MYDYDVRNWVYTLFLFWCLLEQQHMKMSSWWTEVDFSVLAAPPAGHRGTLHGPGCVAEASPISLTNTGESACVTNTCHLSSASLDEEQIASWCGTHRGWFRHISLFFFVVESLLCLPDAPWRPMGTCSSVKTPKTLLHDHCCAAKMVLSGFIYLLLFFFHFKVFFSYS